MQIVRGLSIAIAVTGIAAHSDNQKPMAKDAQEAQRDPQTIPAGAHSGSDHLSSGLQQLQDYQMQLMLLEQQNKKRLLMARHEQGQDDSKLSLKC